MMERRQENRIDDTELQDFFRKIEEEFIRKFHRDMPGEARRYLNLAEQVVRSAEQDLRNDSSREGLRS
jgi:replication-associated recombination protein RarA